MIIEGIEIYKYLVVFHGEAVENYSPILTIDEMSTDEYNNTAHLLIHNLVDVLDSFEFILHLPRLSLDLYNQDELLLDSSYDTPHCILPVPDSYLIQHPEIGGDVTGVFVLDVCEEKAIGIANGLNTPLGVYYQHELNASDIRDIWQALICREGVSDEDIVPDATKHYLLNGEYLKGLPLMSLARQYGHVDEVLEAMYSSPVECIDDILFGIYFKLKSHNNALVTLRSKGIDTLTEDTFHIIEEAEKTEREIFSPNVVMTLPGIAAAQRKMRPASLVIPEDELRMIRFLGMHRSIAKNAAYIELPQIDKDDFVEYNKLEIGGTNDKKPKASHIDKVLSKIGERLDHRLSEWQKTMLYRAHTLTVFSDFPIGLVIPPHMTAPLCLSTSVSYRTLTPLTRCVEQECHKIWQVDLSHRCHVLFLDCIKEDDIVKHYSNIAYDVLKRFSDSESEFGSSRFSVEFKRVRSVDELMVVLRNPGIQQNTDILYISAHGFSRRDHNYSGIMIDDELWMADSNDFYVPRFIILSACSTSPRGTGTVNIADFLIRAGATAVLSTMVPVNAMTNMVLMTRLFTYIVEAQKGSEQYRTLADAWSGVVASNAIHEIRVRSKKFNNWLNEDRPGKQPRIIEFQLRRCVGRLRRTHIYEDTISIIKEMLHEEGMDGKFDNILSEKDYYPESYFYQMIGYPENIFLRNKVFDDFRKWMKGQGYNE